MADDPLTSRRRRRRRRRRKRWLPPRLTTTPRDPDHDDPDAVAYEPDPNPDPDPDHHHHTTTGAFRRRKMGRLNHDEDMGDDEGRLWLQRGREDSNNHDDYRSDRSREEGATKTTDDHNDRGRSGDEDDDGRGCKK
ncbi:hypothetical protein EDB84DRAFT_1559058 [Lactarius hengduanensis]|nr:hypothetical protein EDB84DRAFT_1559058 [Lactarius hengduanensis]